MDEQTQQEFISWLTQQLGIESEDELQQQLNQMGDDGIRQAFEVFQKEKQTPMNKQGGKLEYLQRLQTGGLIKKPIKPVTEADYTSPVGNVVTSGDLQKVKAATGIQWQNNKAYGDWLDRFAKPLPTNNSSNVMYPFGDRGETMTQAEWDYARQQGGYPDVYSDRIGTQNFIKGEIYPNEIRNHIKKFRAMQPMNVQETSKTQQVAKNAKGGSIKDKGQDGKTAVGITNWVKGMDAKTALNRRHDKGTKIHNALNGRKEKGKDGKTAVGITNWVKGKDAKNALGGRKDQGKNEHTALNKKGNA